MTLLELLGNVLRFAGLFVTIIGLWLSANGMRVVVSGRIDERRKSAGALKRGLPLVAVGVLLLIGGSWLAAGAGQ